MKRSKFSDSHILAIMKENAYVERYNQLVRHEWQETRTLESGEPAQRLATQWLCRTTTKDQIRLSAAYHLEES